jgi:hypothetical protein
MCLAWGTAASKNGTALTAEQAASKNTLGNGTLAFARAYQRQKALMTESDVPERFLHHCREVRLRDESAHLEFL